MEDMVMRNNIDFSPLFGSSIGFDRVFDLLDRTNNLQSNDSWPSYNIEKTGDDSYRIVMALAGFSPDQLSLSYEPNQLIVSGETKPEEGGEYLYKGLSRKTFQRRFELSDYVKVTEARMENGLLTIELVRELPEAMKARRIQVKDLGETTAKPMQIEGQQAA